MRKISNSEVTAWLTCRQQYYFAFFKNLAPKDTPMALARGTLGHLYFQNYCEMRLQGATHERALAHAADTFTSAAGMLDMGTILQTKMLCDRYMAYHKGWPEWEIIDVEKQIDLKLTEDVTFPIRYDLMVKEVKTDKVIMVDYKFTYDFWRPEDHSLNGQMPKYIAVMNANGITVHGGAIEEIRTRDLAAAKASDPKNTWRRTHYMPTYDKKKNVLKQHIAASLEISDYWDKSEEDREAATIPVLNKHGACKYCNFKNLCISKLDGVNDLSVAMSEDFVQNTYGYNEQTKLEELL